MELLLGQGYGTDYALGVIPLERTGGSQTQTNTDSVTVNGNVEVGIQNELQVVFLPSDPNSASMFVEDVSQRKGDPSPAFSSVNTTFAAEIDERFDDLYGMLADYSQNPNAKEAIEDEINFLEQSVVSMGVPYTEANGRVVVESDVAIVRIDVHDLYAQAADIYVAGDYFVGDGELPPVRLPATASPSAFPAVTHLSRFR
tara:strand:- start:73 stop:672 length:600 start_codon:yes stop_codon:yes gene_type:complete